MQVEKDAQGEVRILGRTLGRELSNEELQQVAGGELPTISKTAGSDSHPGTCTREADCD
ncbi:bacteriocin [Caulobacter flavus]|jgi:hypothetical protein|uniref:bacteriocin n=1 Tax=Caulobacter flavus TaxID=1679497 RepID=UPI000F43CFAB|nr:bacteriocin [Caulobacter flavus]